MISERGQGPDRLLHALFGDHADFSYDEETEANMRVHLDVARFDRIVSVAFADPRHVAN
jgi:hypothetical protein